MAMLGQSNAGTSEYVYGKQTELSELYLDHIAYSMFVMFRSKYGFVTKELTL